MPSQFTAYRLTMPVTDFVIEECCNKHDLLTVQILGGSNKLAAYSGKPSQLKVDDGWRSRLIAGYLATHATSAGRDKDSVLVAYALGASSVMRSGRERSWKNARPYDIARDVIVSYGFCLEMD